MAKILVVDDNVDTLNLVKMMLQTDSHNVWLAKSGEECLNILNGQKVDLILLDIMMPGMSGYDVFQKVRANDKQTKIAFMTALEASPERQKEFAASGLNGYITKPFTAKELLEKVKKILSG